MGRGPSANGRRIRQPIFDHSHRVGRNFPGPDRLLWILFRAPGPGQILHAGVCKIEAAGRYAFIGFGGFDVTKSYEFILFGDIEAPQSYECLGSGGFYFANTSIDIVSGP